MSPLRRNSTHNTVWGIQNVGNVLGSPAAAQLGGRHGKGARNYDGCGPPVTGDAGGSYALSGLTSVSGSVRGATL